MWLALLKDLQEDIRRAAFASTVTLGGYAPASVRPGDGGMIFLLRNEEKYIGEGDTNVQIFIDIWIKDDDKNLQHGYERINSMEHALDNVLRDYAEKDKVAEDLQLLDFKITEKIGDLDTVRPLVGVRYAITAKIYDLKGDW